MRAVDSAQLVKFLAYKRAADIDRLGIFDARQVVFFEHVEPKAATTQAA